MIIFFVSQINSKETHNFKKIIEVVLTLMMSRYVIQSSKIVKINFFHIDSWAGYSLFYQIFSIIKPKIVLALQIYIRLIPTIYTKKVIPL